MGSGGPASVLGQEWSGVEGPGREGRVRLRLGEKLGFEMRHRLYIAYGSEPEVSLWVGLDLSRRTL